MNLNRFSLRAICAGLLADILASQILVFALILLVAAKAFGAASNTSSAQMTQMLNSLQSAPAFYVSSTALGLLGSMIGGYVAAHLSQRDDAWRNAIAAGSFSLLTSVTAIFSEGFVAPPWILAVALCLSLPATMLGAFLCISGRDGENTAQSDISENNSDKF